MVIELILLTLSAYLLGAVPAAYLAARWFRGIDIRRYGSGNAGAANTAQFTSRRIAVPVIAFDLVKGAAMVWVARYIGLDTAGQVIVGLAAIVGHNWPVFLRFNGGRGIATSLGVVTVLSPWLGLAVLVVALAFTPFHHLPLGVFLVVLCAPAAAWFFSQPLGVADRIPAFLGLLAIFLIMVIRRLTAPPGLLAFSVGRGEILCNRLFFDRDIRDRDAWVRQSRAAGDETKAGEVDTGK